MKIIAFLTSKGGAGKSTNTINTAVAAELAGKLVAVIDLDPQSSVANWSDRRTSDNLVVISTHATRLDSTLDQCKENGADIVLIDTQGRSSSDSTVAARCADLVIVPQRASSVDLDPESMQGNVDVVRLAGKKPHFLINGINPIARSQFEQLREGISQRYNVSVIPFPMPNRTVHTEISIKGQGVQEIAPYSDAARDVQRLWEWIDNMLS